jgi:putative nucleotidyltransferase with HDIG domain
MRQRRIINEQNSKYSILLVDDEIGVIDSLSVVLGKSGYKIDGTVDPLDAVEKLKEEHYDLMILDYLMSPIHGDEVVRLVREFNRDVYILMLTGHKDLAPPIETIRALEIQGYCEKSDRFDQLILLVESGIKSVEQMRELRQFKDELSNTYELLENRYMDTIETLRQVVDAKDVYTRGHSERVSYFSYKIGEHLGLTKEQLEILRVGGLFHDVGKVGIPDRVLLKPSKLDADEYEIIKTHPTKGLQILSGTEAFKEMLPLIVQHHERLDGYGYPNNLKGEEIDFLARIVSVVDAFDAMQSNRAYRSKYTLDRTISQLKEGKGTQFDPDVVDAFVYLLNDYDALCKDLVY